MAVGHPADDPLSITHYSHALPAFAGSASRNRLERALFQLQYLTGITLLPERSFKSSDVDVM